MMRTSLVGRVIVAGKMTLAGRLILAGIIVLAFSGFAQDRPPQTPEARRAAGLAARARPRRAGEARSDDQARHPLRGHQQLSRQARLQGVARVSATARRR